MKNKSHKLFQAKLLLALLFSQLMLPIYAQDTIKVAVRAHSGIEAATNKWTATTDYLSKAIDNYTFQLIPIVKFEDMRIAVENNEVDFVLTNPAAYIDLMSKYEVKRIATLVNGREHKGYAEFGSVVFTQADRNDINKLKDVKNRSILAVDIEAFGGWRMTYLELLEIGIDPFKDCSEVMFSATSTQPDVVFDVLNRKADIGIVRTGILETLVNKGELDLNDIKIIEPKDDNFPLIHTTRLYPEWPFAALKNTDEKLTRKVILALLQLGKEHPASIAGGYTAWEIPLSYTPAINLMKFLKIAPYENYGEMSLYEVFQQHKIEVVLFFALLIILSIVSIIALRLSQHNKNISNLLEIEKNLLEQKVDERTDDFKQANVNLQTEIEVRKKKEVELEIANTIINSSPVVSFRWKNEEGWPIEFVSENVEQLTEYSVDEFMSRKKAYSDIIHKNDIDKVGEEVAHYSAKKDTRSFAHEPYRIITKKGDFKWVEDLTIIRRDANGVITHYEGIVYDNTDKIKAEAELIREKEFSEKIIDTSSAIIVGLDKNHLIRIFNKGAEKITGYSNAEAIGKDWFELFFPDEILDQMNNVWKDAWGISSHSYENSILTKTKEERIISWQSTGFYEGENDAEHLLISIGEDITESKKAEDALKESQAFNRTLLDTSPDLIYVYDIIKSKNIYSNHGIMKILGYSFEEIQTIGENLLPELMHPDDFKVYLNDIIPRYQIAKDGEIIEHEYRMKHKNGHWCWLNSKESIFMRLDDGLPKQIFGLTSDITARKKATENLLTSKNKLESIFRAAPTGIGVVSDHLITEVNQRFCEMTGYSEEELLGKESLIIYPTKKEFERVGKEKYEQIKEKGTGTVETKFKRKDGKIIEVLLSSTPIEMNDFSLGVTFTALDITERKNSEDALRESEEKYRVFFENNDAIILFLDPENGNIIFANEAAAKFYGYTKEKLTAMNISNINALSPEKIKAKIEEAKKRKQNYFVFKHKLASGEIRDVEVYQTKLQLNNKDVFSLLVHDISEKKKTEEELSNYRNHLEEIVKERTTELESSQGALLNLVDDMNHQSTELEKTNANLAAVNQELETFTYSVSHDLKAPLRGIDGYSQLLRDTYYDELNEEAREFLTNIRQSTQQMNVLIEDLLAYSRMERKDYRTEKVPFNALVDNLLLYYSKTIKAKKTDVKLSFPEAIMPIGDKDGLNLVMRNLLDNAIKFTPHNKKSKIEIGASETDLHWLIFVKDNGVGFDMKYHDKIFKIFHRLHLAEEYEGTGIGLAMVSKAMQRMNGRIWAESEIGKGATFYLEIRK